MDTTYDVRIRRHPRRDGCLSFGRASLTSAMQSQSTRLSLVARVRL
jgi:hypothetical protein